MSFQSATQTTELDRVDNIGAVCAEARRRRTVQPRIADMPVALLVQNTHDAAMNELVLRYEPQLRAAANKVRVAPDSDRHQAAMLGFVEAVHAFDPSQDVDIYTFAHTRVVREVSDVNRLAAPRPAPARNQSYYWAAMDQCDGDAVKARRLLQYMRHSVVALEEFAETDPLAREVLNARIDQYEACVRKDPDAAPAWEDYAQRPGRGMDGPTFDAIHAGITYLDSAAELDDGEGESWHETLATPNAGDEIEDLTDRIALDQMMATLDPRERDIMSRHLDGESDRDIADAVGVSRTRVVNIRAAIIKHFKALAEG